MDTFVARFSQPSRLFFAVVLALVVLLIALWLSAAIGGSHDVDPLIGPFRWQPTEAFVA
jgi:hypothetical protein